MLQHVDELEKINKAYSSPPWWYDIRGIMLVYLVYRSSPTRQALFFSRNISSHHLEIPVGNGTFLSICLKFRKRRRLPPPVVIGIDVARSMLNVAKNKFKTNKNINVAWADVNHLEFPPHSFDSINIANGFHCFPDPKQALKEIYRVLKPGGSIAINVLLHPRGIGPIKTIAHRINKWAKINGLLKSTFEPDQAREIIMATGLKIQYDDISGNTLYIVATKS